MIHGYLFGGDKLIATLESLPPQLRGWLTEAVTDATLIVQRSTVVDKLSGQVLHVRTGTLRRSISVKIEQGESSVVGIVGTNVRYGGIHEYGGLVPEHNRLVTMVFGKKIKFPVWSTVKAYNLPERSFLRSALQDNLVTIRGLIQKAVANGVKGVLS